MDLGSLVRRLVPGARGAGARGARAQGGLAGSGAGAPGPASAPAPLTVGEWRSVPPIQRVTGPAPLVAPNAPFRARLATARPAPVALASLGHDRHLEAPAGLATGIAKPVQRSPAEPVPSSVRHRGGAHVHPAAGAATAPAAWTAGEESGPDAAPDPVASSLPSPTLAVVARSAGDTSQSLVSAPSVASPPAGLVGAAAVSRSASVQRSAAVPVPAAADPVGSPGPVDATGIPSGAAPTVSRATSAPGTTRAAPTVGASAPLVQRRVRLGPAIEGRSPGPSRAVPHSAIASAPASPPAGTTPAPSVHAGPAPTVSRSVADADVPDHDHGGTAAAPMLPLARSADTGDAGEPAEADDRVGAGTGEPVVARRAMAAARPSTTPLVGTLRPMIDTGRTTVLQRAAGETPGIVAEAEPGTPAAALAALGRAGPYGVPGFAGPSGGAGVPFGGDSPAGGTGFQVGGPAVARATADVGPGALEPGDAPGWSGNRLSWTNPWLADPAPGSSRGRTAAAGVPNNATASLQGEEGPGPGGPTASRMATASASLGAFASRPRGLRVGPAVQRRAVERVAGDADHPSTHTDGPVASTASPVSVAIPSSGTTGGPVVARELAFDAPPVTLAPLQRVEAGAAAGTEAGAAAGGGAAGPGAPGSPTGEKELDDLARKLYDRIGLRLRRDLLVERERAGALVDRGL
jgi:hypothetical protein